MDFKKTKENVMLFWELLRMRNGLIAFFGVLVGASFIYTEGTPIHWASVFIAGFSAFLITGAGNALNDYCDSEIDRINKPNRPIPSGRISRSDTLMLSTVLFLLGLGFSKSINDLCLMIAFLNSIILVVYGIYSKKMLLVSNLGISFLVSSLFVFGVAATVQEGENILQKFGVEGISLITIITACAFLITMAREVIKDIEDIKGDKEKYAVTLPISIGETRTKKIASAFTLIAILLSLLPFIIRVGAFNLYVYGFILLIADLIFIISLTMHPSLSQRMMVLGMGFALSAFFLANILAL
ncbi:MAG: UbiA family prenyltransferase [Candidatus Altiarchaeota archaeon]|nr:UbiA family prenyltransferase [Candidatus Altiarchaeota archaeon]